MTTERITLTDHDVAYLVGRSGATRLRLESFSGAHLSIDRDCAEVEGTAEQRELAKLAIQVTLQQRNGGAVSIDFEELEQRTDVSTFDVPKETVGFLLGAKGHTLRAMETEHKVFMFFNNDRLRQGTHGPCKRLYVIGTLTAREAALDEAEDVVRFKLTGESKRYRDFRGSGPCAPRSDTLSTRGTFPRRDDHDRHELRYDQFRPRSRYEDRGCCNDRGRYDARGPPPPRCEGRDPSIRYHDRSRYSDPPMRYDDRYDDRRVSLPSRYERRHDERDYYIDRRPLSRHDGYYDERGPPPR